MVFVNIPLIFPLPLEPIPVIVPPVLSLVQLNVVEATLPDNTIVVTGPPEQIVWLDGVITTLGVGFTITVAVVVEPGQLFADGVTVNVIVIGAVVKLVNEPEIFPLPLAGKPVTPKLSLVHV